jgi:hypothetical protein
VLAAPAVSCAMSTRKCAHEHTGTAGALRHSLRNGLTAYAELSPETNSSCLRRRRIEDRVKPGWASQNLRRLDTSHGCQDHTVLPYATPVFVKRLRRTQVQVRRSFSEGGSVVRLRAVVHSRQSRPANTLHADAAASTASHPASVTTRDPPLVRDETAELIVLIWGDREGNCFCARGWTGQITMKTL